MSTAPAGQDERGAVRRFLAEHESRISEMKYSLFLFRKNVLAVLGLVLILVVIVIAFIAPWLAIELPTYVNVNGQLQQRWQFHDVCLSPWTNAPPTQPVLLGSPVVHTYVGTNLTFVAMTSDPDVPADDLNWTWNWGDGTQDVSGGTTSTTGMYGHAYPLAGEYSVYVSVNDGYSTWIASANQIVVTVDNPPLYLGAVQGFVKDTTPSHLPIAGAELVAYPSRLTAVTDATGGYNLSLPAGTYNLSAGAQFFASVNVTAAVTANTTNGLNLTLAANVGWVAGQVTSSATGANISLAIVEAELPTGNPVEVGVDSQGRYNVSLTPGTYTMNATAYGHRFGKVSNVSVVSGETHPLPIALAPLVVDCQVFLAPSSAHPFGTDNFGEDWYSKVLYGASLSLEIGLLVVLPASLVGSLLGLVAGFKGGILEEVIMRVTDIFLSIPSLILAIAITAVLGRSIVNVTYALIITWWPWYTRLVRGQVLSLKERQFIESARSVGASPTRLMLRHVLPNSVSPVIVQASMDFGYVILTAAGLGFLGLGAPPGTAEWGVMISEGLTYLFNAPWMAVFPGLAIVLTVLGFNLLGDGLRDILDPRLRR